MSVICEIAFGDRVVTRMTVWCDMPDALDMGRALVLARYAYESRTHRPPPERDITIAAKTYRLPHILALRYHTMDGKAYTTGEGELIKDLIMGMIFSGASSDEREAKS